MKKILHFYKLKQLFYTLFEGFKIKGISYFTRVFETLIFSLVLLILFIFKGVI